MRIQWIWIILLASGCKQSNKTKPVENLPAVQTPRLTYQQTIEQIKTGKQQLAAKFGNSITLNNTAMQQLTNFWVHQLSDQLYGQWKQTPWDFNGIADAPGQAPIACGIFVTTLLRDMGLPVSRIKTGILASSGIMHAVVPGQQIRNFSQLSYAAFNDSISKRGKAIYIVGLDQHTGFIVNDATGNWFLHSNYIQRRGVTKEPMLQSIALRSSKTRWLICLTSDSKFYQRWLKG